MFISTVYAGYNPLWPGQNSGQLADDISTSFSPVKILIQIPLNIVYYGPTDNKQTLI